MSSEEFIGKIQRNNILRFLGWDDNACKLADIWNICRCDPYTI